MQRTKKRHIFIGSALLFLIALNTHAQIVNIPDANLRKAINGELGKPADAQLTQAEMAKLTSLNASAKEIKNLRGLEAAIKLEILRLNHNQITNLSPIAGLVRLNRIELGHNKISDISPLEALINLENLRIDNNSVSDISVLEALISLRSVKIGHNVVSDWSPLAGLMKLDYIAISHNPVADLSPLTGLRNLRTFHSWGTPILDIAPLSKSPKIEEINICGGDISDISSLEGVTSLRDLYLPNNDVTDISALASLTGLTRLSLNDNEVSNISVLKKLRGLTWVNLRANAISDVSPLSELSNLTWLDISLNSITDVSALTFLPNLRWLGLNKNPIADPSTLDRFSTKTAISHSYLLSPSDSGPTPFPEAGPKIEGPWLWVIVPGTAIGKADLLARASGGAATEVKVATFGAKEDKAVGSSVWTAHRLSARGGDNLNAMTDALGWGSGSEIYDHVVYGSVSLESPRQQKTTMLVGSDDEVKVWLNGEVVHYNPVLRGAGDYQDAFPVKLKKGTNVLLVAVSNRGHGAFSGFFGFAKDTDYTLNAPSTPIKIEVATWDVNRDGVVNILDMILVARDLGKTAREALSRTDVNGDGKRNILDLRLVAQHLNEASGAAAPAAATSDEFITTDPISAERVRAWIAQAQAQSDGSLVFRQGIANLKRLLASLVPDRTAVLPNYPNPFNPETWIPYQLAEATEVTVHIYAANGALVRTLDLGHQPAGRYQERSRAAYWNGENEIGEPVASGVYFYTLIAADFTATRKMVILK